MTQYWFRPKTHGYGASPANGQGWVATAAFVAILVCVSIVVLASQQNLPSGPFAWQISAWALLVVALTLGFVWLARAKSSGQWGWRWGK
jgi:uncharacterized BrkB/YihY/UPF0761 family membrane protein